MRDKRESIAVATFAEALLSDLDEAIRSGEVTVEASSDRYFAQLQSTFPVLGSKIAWSKVPGALEEVAAPDAYIEDCLRFYDRVLGEYALHGTCVVIGDSQVDFSLVTTVQRSRDYLARILAIPQHHYIVSAGFTWCIAFTMEGEMAFGFAPVPSCVYPSPS
jgi:hypothetical protein